MRIHHVAIRVNDLETCLAFYRDVLGLRELPAPREGAAWLALTDGILMLEETRGAPAPDAFESDRPGIHLIALTIGADERAEWEKRLAGLLVHRSDHTLYVRDPEGNRIGLSSYVVPQW